MPPTGLGLTFQPMVHVDDMASSVSFYEQLGARVLHASRDGEFTLLDLGGSQISLLAHPPNPEQHEGKVELNFETGGSLDDIETQLRSAGVTIARPATTTSFGAQLQITSPDGLLVKINRVEPDQYR